MENYDAATYGNRIADVYDSWHSERPPADDTVAFLAALANNQRTLELGIGTGRIALPLAAQAIPIQGIDASERMVAHLRAKPGGEAIPVTMGDFADVPMDGRFGLIFVVFNTFFSLLTQEDQIRCFRNVAEHLTDDGAFVIEAFVPDTARYRNGQSLGASSLGLDQVRMDLAQHDPLNQRISARHLVFGASGIQVYPVELRYAWPSELDLMARLASLRLQERWATWTRAPFTAKSTSHVSVYVHDAQG